MKFIGDRRAPSFRAAFEDEWFESCFGQVKCSNQPVMAAANDDDVAPVRFIFWHG
jgi:hypothetical protein